MKLISKFGRTGVMKLTVAYDKGKYRTIFELSGNVLTIKIGKFNGRYHDMHKGLTMIRVEDIIGAVHIKGSHLVEISLYNGQKLTFDYLPTFNGEAPVDEMDKLIEELTNKIGIY